MSAIAPKADIGQPRRHVRFVPKADICKRMLQCSEGASQRRKQAVAREYNHEPESQLETVSEFPPFGDYVSRSVRAHRFFSLIRRGQAHELQLKLLAAVPRSA
jgi:hypothetical protein